MKVLKQPLYGWSKTVYSNSEVFFPESISDVCQIIKKAKDNKTTVSIRGAGLSYGDNTLNKNGIVLCTEKMYNSLINYINNK